MFEYIDSDSLPLDDKILYLINDLEKLRRALSMLSDESENEEVTSILDGADAKVASIVNDMDEIVWKLKDINCTPCQGHFELV